MIVDLDKFEALQLARHYAEVIHRNPGQYYTQEGRDDVRKWVSRLIHFITEYERLEAQENRELRK